MKLHRLEIEGFGPFRDEQTVDFDAFADDGIFLIAGRTGAGKSSVLDGVCYALYGGIPRYDGAERRLRSDHCTPDDPTRVSLEFTAENRRWRVTRSPEYERPKLRGGGLTTEPHRAVLERWDDDRWVGVAARPVDVAAHLDEILGLSQQQFLQVILLAQNRFARFLLARNDERQALLRTLFGTRTYEEYERILDDRRKTAEQRLAAEGESVRMLVDEGERMTRAADLGGSGDSVAVHPDDIAARVGALVRAVERAEYRVDTASRERGDAERDLEAALASERALAAVRDRQEQRLAARAELDRLEKDAPGIAAARAMLDRAIEAESVRTAIEAADRATLSAAAAAEAAMAARAAWLDEGEDAATAEDLRLRDDVLTGALAACDDALAIERQLSQLDEERRRLRTAVEDAERELAELDARRADVPAALDLLATQIAALASAPAAQEAARARRDELTRRRDAAREAEALADRLRRAEREALTCGAALQAAVAAHTALLQRRLDGAAGDLAATLVDGDPCPVCGSADHPSPAHPSDAPVTDAELDSAEVAKDAAITADRVAAEALRSAREAHGEASARAGGESVATLADALAAARDEVARADTDAETLDRLGREREQLATLDAEAGLARERLSAEAGDRRQGLALADQSAADLRSRVDRVRAGFATVVERRADANRRRALARALIDALADDALHARVLVDALRERDARLAESPFAHADEARAAFRPASERTELDERVRGHDAAVRSQKQRLLELELELVDAPAELIDLAGPAAAVAAAQERFAVAVAAHADAASIATRLRDLTQRADAAHRGIADLAADHAAVARLAHTVAGRAPNTHRMTLETFVLAAELEEIVDAANLRLEEMSAGRYRLRHTDARAARGAASGLGLEVLDAFTGQPRPPQSLSGGETFLASLALALGLAEVVTARTGGIRLDTLFIDEGFGSLDDETLELAMRALDELRQGGRTVGVISHVAAMKEQVPAQLVVSATGHGPSVIRQATAVAV